MSPEIPIRAAVPEPGGQWDDSSATKGERVPRVSRSGFAVQRTGPDGKAALFLNRVSFMAVFTSAATATDFKWTPTDKAPFQKFWWVDFLPKSQPGENGYKVLAMRFKWDGISLPRAASRRLAFLFFSPEKIESFSTRLGLPYQSLRSRFVDARS